VKTITKYPLRPRWWFVWAVYFDGEVVEEAEKGGKERRRITVGGKKEKDGNEHHTPHNHQKT